MAKIIPGELVQIAKKTTPPISAYAVNVRRDQSPAERAARTAGAWDDPKQYERAERWVPIFYGVFVLLVVWFVHIAESKAIQQ